MSNQTLDEFVNEALDVAWLNVELAAFEGRLPSTLEDRLLITTVGFLMAWREQKGVVKTMHSPVAEQYAGAILGHSLDGIEYNRKSE